MSSASRRCSATATRLRSSRRAGTTTTSVSTRGSRRAGRRRRPARPVSTTSRSAIPNRKALAQALKQLVDAEIPLSGATDHGVSEAIYLRDPDDNGIELYRDRPQEEWPRADDGSMSMISEPLDLRALLAEAD